MAQGIRKSFTLPVGADERLTRVEAYLYNTDGIKPQEFRRDAIMKAVRAAEYDRQHRESKEA